MNPTGFVGRFPAVTDRCEAWKIRSAVQLSKDRCTIGRIGMEHLLSGHTKLCRRSDVRRSRSLEWTVDDARVWRYSESHTPKQMALDMLRFGI